MAKIIPTRAVCPVCGGPDPRRYGKGFACTVGCMDIWKRRNGIPLHAQVNRLSLAQKEAR